MQSPDLDSSDYDALIRLAARYLQGALPGTLSPSVLVHEAWLKLGRRVDSRWNGPEHFKATAARAMRQILVDRARSARAKQERVTVASGMFRSSQLDLDMEALDTALVKLEEEDARCARVVEMRFFGGLSYREIAGSLGISERTAQDDWAFSRSWLLRELSV